jgi:hypothetical protein
MGRMQCRFPVVNACYCRAGTQIPYACQLVSVIVGGVETFRNSDTVAESPCCGGMGAQRCPVTATLMQANHATFASMTEHHCKGSPCVATAALRLHRIQTYVATVCVTLHVGSSRECCGTALKHLWMRLRYSVILTPHASECFRTIIT